MRLIVYFYEISHLPMEELKKQRIKPGVHSKILKNGFMKNIYILSVFILFSAGIKVVKSQTYGLGFKGPQYTLDERTELNLTPDGFMDFKDEFELSFDILLNLDVKKSYGYVFRVMDQNGWNVDLIKSDVENNATGFHLVSGETDSVINIDFQNDLLKDWLRLRVKFFLSENRLIFYTPDTFFVQDNLGFTEKSRCKIIFGSNDYEQFKSTDVPSMNIKDIRISEKGKLKYHWPLDENDGGIATDKISNSKAAVKNPKWLKPAYQSWKLELNEKVSGNTLIAFDNRNDLLYVVQNQDLLVYSVKTKNISKLLYKNKPQFKLRGCQAFYNSKNNSIYVYDLDTKQTYSIDAETGEWMGSDGTRTVETEYLHHNKLWYEKDQSLYVFGGYGQYKYKKSIFRFDLENNTWSVIPDENQVFSPRYMAGVGYNNDTIYLLGGYGSASGDQLINPTSYYDFIAYSVKDTNFVRKFEIAPLIQDMCIANSMYINARTRTFYALGYEKVKYEGYLQLISGSLDRPDVKLLGDRIPYKFLDTDSYADLFYSLDEKKLLCYTSFYNKEEQTTDMRLYSISFPPNQLNVANTKTEKAQYFYWIFIALGIVLLGLVALWYVKRKNKGPEVGDVETESTEQIKEIDAVLTTELSDWNNTEKIDYRLILFGGFQIFSKDKEDFTNKFTPLLKELFLLIFLHSYKNDKGISSNKLTEYLWYDKSERSASNNRAVNIAKLRTVMSDIGGMDLTSKTGYWKIVLSDEVRCDYLDLLRITDSKVNLTHQKVLRLMEISHQGTFLSNVSYAWLDDFKSAVSDCIVDTLVGCAQSSDIQSNAEFIVLLSDCIFNFDPINEEALKYKCKAQFLMGKHSSAEKTYQKFVKEYKLLYGEEYTKSYTDTTK